MYFSYKNLTLYLLYTIAIEIASLVLKPISLFNKKLALGISGRKETFSKLKATIAATDKTMWFHCSSLGEYEQGLPVFKKAKQLYPNHKVVLSFFSPSGYEIRKNAPIADVVVYLPFDTKKNAKRFLNAVHPDLTIYIKYEIWPNMLNELKKRNTQAILISALFRTNQSLFKWYLKPVRNALFTFNHIFTQNEASKQILEQIGYKNVTVSGDTRFDRVTHQLEQNNTLNFISEFKADSTCIVIGSSWPEDEKIIIDYINNNTIKNIKFIIAPHNIKPQQIQHLQKQINKKTVRYTNKTNQKLEEYQVFIIDTIGILSKIYTYADIAYVGGAMGKTGLHNTLEPATFGVPIIIGTNYNNFPEAKQMKAIGGLFSVSNSTELTTIFNDLINSKQKRETAGALNLEYIKENKGAVIKIVDWLKTNSIL